MFARRWLLVMSYAARLGRRAWVPACALGFVSYSFAGPSSSTLPGFTLVGEDWTYDPGDGGVLITGKLVEPTTGVAPHPAVLISHGQGGSAASFSMEKANVMKTWGLVCIAPNYTHVDGSFPPGTDGWSAENERRARACLAILASRSDVDATRIAAYGNSKGAFLTAGLCGAVLPGEIRAAAITAGGTSGTSSTISAAPTPAEVAGTTAPFLLLHGAVDTTVTPAYSAELESILVAHSVPVRRYVWSGVGHDLHAVRSADVYALLRAWFTERGVLGDPGNSPPTMSALADVAVPRDASSGPIAFTVGDARTSPSALVVTALRLSTDVLPPSSVVLGGSGAARTVAITPPAGTEGSSTVVVVVDDGALSTARAFRFAAGASAQGPFCTGDGLDPNVTTACPCGNSGAPGRGCAHSANAEGAILTGDGTTSPDAHVLAANRMPATTTCVFLQGDALADVAFGDGVRCAGGTLIRLRVRTSVAGGAEFPTGSDPSLSTRGQVTPGSGAVRYYQAYYRNASVAFCPPDTFNVTNGWRIAW